MPTPTSPPLGDAWTFTSEQVVATPKNGSAATTMNATPTTGVKLTYTDATHYSMHVQAVNSAGGYHLESTYTYQGQTLDYAAFHSWNTGRNVPKTVQVMELTAHKLVTAEKWESQDTQYATTLTYTR